MPRRFDYADAVYASFAILPSLDATPDAARMIIPWLLIFSLIMICCHIDAYAIDILRHAADADSFRRFIDADAPTLPITPALYAYAISCFTLMPCCRAMMASMIIFLPCH